MSFLKFSFLFFLPLIWFGCVTRAVQTEALLANPGNLPFTSEITEVKFIDQSVGYCGPATLTMAMQWAGKNISVDEVAKQIYIPGFQGSLQSDLIGASRRQGLMAIQIKDLRSLLIELSAGHPVIIFENLSLSWAPNWHYALILGYDFNKQEMIMHSGHDAFYRWDMRKFERSWMLGEYWGLVVLPPGELAASAGELAHAKAAAGLEQINKDPEAEKSYRKILDKWPTSLVPLIGLANIAYKKADRKEAILLLQRALKAHPESEAVKHNLAVAKSNKAEYKSR